MSPEKGRRGIQTRYIVSARWRGATFDGSGAAFLWRYWHPPDDASDSSRPLEFRRLSAGELRQSPSSVGQFGRWMDTAFEVPLVGWRFGLDAILGLIPGLGAAATTIVSLYLLALAGCAGVLWIATQGLFSTVR